MPDRPNIEFLLNKTPEEIVNWFKDKDYLISWNWRDVEKEMHSRAFTVAKAMNTDVLSTIRGSVEDALENGTTVRQFRKDLEPELKKLGWWGKQEVVDPDTGEVTEVQLGSPRRLKTIYRTNLQTAYSRGKYRHQIKVAERRPWWMYDAVNDANTRPKHAEMDNTVKRYDDPWWDTNYTPNGWGCRCVVRTLSDRQLKARGLKPTEGGGDIADEGWDFNPAKSYYQPDLDKTWPEAARKYVQSALGGPGLGHMYQRTKDAVDQLKKQDIAQREMLQSVKGAIAREEFPVAILPQKYREAIGASGHTVLLSAETLAKNLIRHPELSLRDYRKLQVIYRDAQLVIKDSSNSLGFYYQSNEELFSAVKATIKGDKMYLVSFRKASNQKIDNIKKRGEVLKDEL